MNSLQRRANPRQSAPVAAPASAVVAELAASHPCSQQELDAALLRRLQAAVRSDEAALREATAAVKKCFRADDSRVRLASLVLAAWLFDRSKLFRALLCAWLPELVHYTCSTPLPPPAPARLQEAALQQLRDWQREWGVHYAQLAVALQRLQAPAPTGLRSEAEEAAAAAARAHALLVQRRRAAQPELEAAFAQARAALARADDCVAVVCASAPPSGAAGEEECWEEVEAPSAEELRLRLPPAPPSAAAQDALRAVLHDLRALQPALERWLALLREADGADGAALTEGAGLWAAVGVAAQRCAELLGTTAPPLPPPRPPASRAPAAPPPARASGVPSKRARLEASLARLAAPHRSVR